MCIYTCIYIALTKNIPMLQGIGMFFAERANNQTLSQFLVFGFNEGGEERRDHEEGEE
jgi:hypothetical protein